jgi:hypothetical protein
LLAPVYRAAAGDLAAAGCLGDASVYRQIGQVEADHAVVGIPRDAFQAGHDPGRDPFVAAATEGALGAGVVGDPLVSAAEHQDLDELVEHDPIRDTRSVAAQRMGVVAFGEHRGELVPDGFDQPRWQGRHGGVKVGGVWRFP